MDLLTSTMCHTCTPRADRTIDNGTQFIGKAGYTAWPTQFNPITRLTTVFMSSVNINQQNFFICVLMHSHSL